MERKACRKQQHKPIKQPPKSIEMATETMDRAQQEQHFMMTKLFVRSISPAHSLSLSRSIYVRAFSLNI